MIRTIFIFLVFFVGTQVHAQLIPPAKPDGFVYPPGRHRVDPDTILIEAFYDPVCPYSRDSWPPLKQALKHYGSRVSLLLHLLPLPYHDNAYVTSRALHIVNTFNANATFSLLEGFFKHQAMFYGAQTQLLTRPEVVGRIVKLGTATLGNSYQHVLKSGFNDTKSDRATRVSFKYSASRGVYGTPTFYVNGFKLPDADDPSDFGGWKKIIDSLVQPHKGASRGRGIGGYSGPQNEYDAPQDGGYGYEQHGYDDRGGYDGPQGGGHGRGSGRGGRGRGGGGGGRSGGFNNRSDGPPVQVVA